MVEGEDLHFIAYEEVETGDLLNALALLTIVQVFETILHTHRFVTAPNGIAGAGGTLEIIFIVFLPIAGLAGATYWRIQYLYR